MAQPFTLTLIPDAKPLTLKPGWHKRALAAERRHKATTAPQKGNPDADAKAVTYAVWLAARDGIAIPGDGAASRVDWQPCASGYRPRAVEWMPARQPYRPAARGMAQPAVEPLLRIELPHWDYEAPAVIETTLLDWSAPVVIEVPCGEPDAAIVEPCQPPAVCEPDPADAVPLAALCASDDDAPAAPGPVTVLCLSHKARESVLRRIDGRAVPDYGQRAKGGAFRLSLDDAAACAGLRSVRFVGLPRKPYTRAVAPMPTPASAIRTPLGAMGHPTQSAPFLAALATSLRRGHVACYSASTL
ncbi:hypothetical protein JRF84_08070 [Methylobacterium organophilum]|uniref:hypothetical protein n=1 Tax=Methylobacterium TaxID=407 RepID=UPI0019D251B1|nr:hypothetical protein [Methylobacterium organophilum]MBN6819544.1 hypothetical protein [Methylobacterium organophilum]